MMMMMMMMMMIVAVVVNDDDVAVVDDVRFPPLSYLTDPSPRSACLLQRDWF
jgi:hypothetical protein